MLGSGGEGRRAPGLPCVGDSEPPPGGDMGEWPVREGDHPLNWAGELGVLWGGSPPCPPPSPPSSFPPVALVIPASCRGASVAHITALLPLVSAVELAHAGPW